jgi:hypothetical protein
MGALEQYVFIVCGFFWGLQDPEPTKDQSSSCEEIVITSLSTGEDPTLMLSIAWHESTFRSRVKSPAGAIGPLQVLPRYWCPQGSRKGCDLISAGFKAWTTYFKMEKGNEKQALCRYNSGRKCASSSAALRYSKRVLETRDALVASIFSNWQHHMVSENCARCPECCTEMNAPGR